MNQVIPFAVISLILSMPLLATGTEPSLNRHYKVMKTISRLSGDDNYPLVSRKLSAPFDPIWLNPRLRSPLYDDALNCKGHSSEDLDRLRPILEAGEHPLPLREIYNAIGAIIFCKAIELEKINRANFNYCRGGSKREWAQSQLQEQRQYLDSLYKGLTHFLCYLAHESTNRYLGHCESVWREPTINYRDVGEVMSHLIDAVTDFQPLKAVEQDERAC